MYAKGKDTSDSGSSDPQGAQSYATAAPKPAARGVSHDVYRLHIPASTWLRHCQVGVRLGTPNSARSDRPRDLGDFVEDDSSTSEMWGEKSVGQEEIASERRTTIKPTAPSEASGFSPPRSYPSLADNVLIATKDKANPKQSSSEKSEADIDHEVSDAGLAERKAPRRYPDELSVEVINVRPISKNELIDYRDRLNTLAMTPRSMTYIAGCPNTSGFERGPEYYRGKIADNISDFLRFVDENKTLRARMESAGVAVKREWEWDNPDRLAFYQAYDVTKLDSMAMAELEAELRSVQEDAKDLNGTNYVMRVLSQQLDITARYQAKTGREKAEMKATAQTAMDDGTAVSEQVMADLIGLSL